MGNRKEVKPEYASLNEGNHFKGFTDVMLSRSNVKEIEELRRTFSENDLISVNIPLDQAKGCSAKSVRKCLLANVEIVQQLT